MVIPVIGFVGVRIHHPHELAEDRNLLDDLGVLNFFGNSWIGKDLFQGVLVTVRCSHQYDFILVDSVPQWLVVPLDTCFLEVGEKVVLGIPGAPDQERLDLREINVPQDRLVDCLKKLGNGLAILGGPRPLLGNVGLDPGLRDGQRPGDQTQMRQPAVHHDGCQLSLAVGVASFLENLQVDLVPAILFDREVLVKLQRQGVVGTQTYKFVLILDDPTQTNLKGVRIKVDLPQADRQHHTLLGASRRPGAGFLYHLADGSASHQILLLKEVVRMPEVLGYIRSKHDGPAAVLGADVLLQNFHCRVDMYAYVFDLNVCVSIGLRPFDFVCRECKREPMDAIWTGTRL
mmetsp:Transcript_6917/g.16942  ORF Transcript_6917/g.16942 Transcript_6917/m.16942 type:complete len:345 (-) Transcript_6917:157-1191(-)